MITALRSAYQKALICGIFGMISPVCEFAMVAAIFGSFASCSWYDFSATAPSGLSLLTSAKPSLVSR
ncbi:hypothetical protein D3C87_1670670 [compost metagenome]